MAAPAPDGSSELEVTLGRNLATVRARMRDACTRAGRSADEVHLVCVTKAFSLEAVRALLRVGVRDLGENRVAQLHARQVAFTACPETPGPLRWHMIGHLQRRKAGAYLATGALLHSLESERLLAALERHLQTTAPEQTRAPLDVLVEVSVAGEDQKHGLPPEAVPAFLDRVAASAHLRAVGLMCMAPRRAAPGELHRLFASLRALRDEHRAHHPHLRELSMGMSGDFEIACEEGATMVRIGSALTEGLAA
jgi:pyridoxal phosphate enzyme (YggS family)